MKKNAFNTTRALAHGLTALGFAVAIPRTNPLVSYEGPRRCVQRI
jgi:hypothetical protein